MTLILKTKDLAKVDPENKELSNLILRTKDLAGLSPKLGSGARVLHFFTLDLWNQILTYLISQINELWLVREVL